ncbi:MAG: hypothetical protein U0529_22550 [Thermoanaerobaculia bacterium]
MPPTEEQQHARHREKAPRNRMFHEADDLFRAGVLRAQQDGKSEEDGERAEGSGEAQSHECHFTFAEGASRDRALRSLWSVRLRRDSFLPSFLRHGSHLIASVEKV